MTYVFSASELIEHDAAIEARVRAEVAEEIAGKIEASKRELFAEDTTYEFGWNDALDDAAEIARSFAAGSSPDTTPEPAREDYPGQRRTPDACPVCGGRVEVDRLDVTSVFTPMEERPKTIPGRWWCPKGCDPRTTPEPRS
jgi:hypothetical protein